MLARTICACERRIQGSPAPRSYRAVFLDRDGTLIVDKPYNADPAEIELLPGTLVALALLRAVGYRLVVVTNQSGVARGYFGLRQVEQMHEQLDGLLRRIGRPILGYYVCPHHPLGGVKEYRRTCPSRKPSPGMLLHAARDFAIDLRRSWMIGDLLTDAQAGRAAGCRTIQIGRRGEFGAPIRVDNLATAALQIIVRDAGARCRAPEWPRSTQPG